MSLKRCEPGHCPLCDDARRLERATTGPACPVLVGIVEMSSELFAWLRQYAEIIGATASLGADYRYRCRMTQSDFETYVKPRQREGHLLARMRAETPAERKSRRYAEAEAAEADREYARLDEEGLDRYRRHPKSHRVT